MAREPGPRVTPETFARGSEPEAPEHREPVLSATAAALVIAIAAIIDIVGFFEVEIPISDVLALSMNAILLYKGVSQTRWLVGQLLELIPLVGILPIYTIGILAVIAADRSGIASVVEKAPVPSGKKALARGAASGAAKRQSRRLASNKVFGEAAEASSKRAETLLKRIPGPLRSLPGDADHAPDGTPLPGGRRRAVSRIRTAIAARGAASAPAGPPPEQDGELPFPDTYYRYERELLPELADITADIDVTGEKAAEKAARTAAGGPAAEKKV